MVRDLLYTKYFEHIRKEENRNVGRTNKNDMSREPKSKIRGTIGECTNIGKAFSRKHSAFGIPKY